MTEKELLEFIMKMEIITNTPNSILSIFINIFKDFMIGTTNSTVITSFIKIIIIYILTYIGLTNVNYKAYKKNISISFNNDKKAKKLRKNILKKEDSFNNEYRYKSNKISLSYIVKEFKMLIRTPIFFMQCIIPIVIVPIILFTPFLMNLNNLEVLDMPSLEELKKLAITKEGICVIIIIMQFLYMMNITAITAVSRDNKNAVFMKYIPISLDTQCMYKVVFSLLFNIIPTLYLVGCLKFILDFKVWDIILITISALLMSFFESLLLIILDLKNPKINWDSEITVVKQNMNIMKGYLYQIAVSAIIVTMIIVIKTSIINILGIIDICLILAIIVVKTYIKKTNRKLFSKIY